MTEESKSKQQKANEDRISSLPDPLLIKILSSLPTKTSVQTSILSPRWRHIWKHLSVLNFSDDFIKFNDEFIQNNSERYKHFIRVFLSLSSFIYLLESYKLQKMRLSFTKSLTNHRLCTTSVNAWIRSVMGPLIKELELKLYTIDDYCFQIPNNISNCTNLVSLSLEGAICLDLQQAKSFSLPSLKKLQLNISGMDVTSLNIFLNGCTCLENLELYFYAEDYSRIFMPSLCLPPSLLKLLKITVYNSNLGSSLETEVLQLEYLSITDAGNLQDVVEASLDCSNASTFTLIKLFQALSGIKHLVFSRSATKWLMGGIVDLHFPNFCHLLHLELILPWFSSNSLLSLLQKCHLLRVLIIQNDNEVCNDKEVCDDKEEQSCLAKWAAQPSVPRCLESHLSFIQFKGYRGFPDELFFAEYILQKGNVLKTMIIVDISSNLKKKFDTLKRLSIVPRASGMCQLTFD